MDLEIPAWDAKDIYPRGEITHQDQEYADEDGDENDNGEAYGDYLSIFRSARKELSPSPSQLPIEDVGEPEEGEVEEEGEMDVVDKFYGPDYDKLFEETMELARELKKTRKAIKNYQEEIEDGIAEDEQEKEALLVDILKFNDFLKDHYDHITFSKKEAFEANAQIYSKLLDDEIIKQRSDFERKSEALLNEWDLLLDPSPQTRLAIENSANLPPLLDKEISDNMHKGMNLMLVLIQMKKIRSTAVVSDNYYVSFLDDDEKTHSYTLIDKSLL